MLNYLKLSLDYMQYGLYQKACDILENCNDGNPLTEYYKGYAQFKLGNTYGAMACYKKAETIPSDYIFQNLVEEMIILENAVQVLGSAPMANYYLGNLLYDKKQYEKAVKCREDTVIEFCEKTLVYPNNLGEGKLENVPDNKAYYYIGKCHKALGNTEKSKEYFALAAVGSSEPSPVKYYNDQRVIIFIIRDLLMPNLVTRKRLKIRLINLFYSERNI